MFMAADAPKLAAIAAAFKQINKELANAPTHLGESRDNEEERIHLIRPLGIEFEVRADQTEVWVMRVWDYS